MDKFNLIVGLLGLVVFLSSCHGADRIVDEYLYFGSVPSEQLRAVVWLRNKIQSSVSPARGPEATLDYLTRLLDGVTKRQRNERIADDRIGDSIVRFERSETDLNELEDLLKSLIDLADLDDERFCTAAAVRQFILTFRAINLDTVIGLQELYPASEDDPFEGPPKLYTFMKHYAALHHRICWPMFEQLFERATSAAGNSEKRYDSLMESELANGYSKTDKNLATLAAGMELKDGKIGGHAGMTVALREICTELRPQVADFTDVWNFGRLMYAYPMQPSEGLDARINKLHEYSRICLQLDNPIRPSSQVSGTIINKKSNLSYLSQDTAK